MFELQIQISCTQNHPSDSGINCAFVDEGTCVENVNKLFSVQRFASNDNIKFLTNVAICTLEAPANGLRNIVGCYMLCPFAHPVACCCVLLGVVAQSLIPVKRLAKCNRTQQFPTMLGYQCWELLRPFARSLINFTNSIDVEP